MRVSRYGRCRKGLAIPSAVVKPNMMYVSLISDEEELLYPWEKEVRRKLPEMLPKCVIFQYELFFLFFIIINILSNLSVQQFFLSYAQTLFTEHSTSWWLEPKGVFAIGRKRFFHPFSSFSALGHLTWKREWLPTRGIIPCSKSDKTYVNCVFGIVNYAETCIKIIASQKKLGCVIHGII